MSQKQPPIEKNTVLEGPIVFNILFVETRGQFSRFFGFPEGPPNLQKTASLFFLENGGPTTVIFSMFAVNAAATNLSSKIHVF